MQTLITRTNSFTERKVSIKKAISILAKNNISVDEDEASMVLEFLYLLAKSYHAKREVDISSNPKGISNHQKVSLISI